MHAENIIKDKHKKNESNVIIYFTTSVNLTQALSSGIYNRLFLMF